MKKLITSILFLGLIFSTNAQNGAPAATTATAGTLTVTYSTKTISPLTESFYAIYITNSGTLVNTLAYLTSNGDGSAKDYLSTWWVLVGQSTSTTSTKFVGNSDGITGATTSTFVTGKKVYWGRSVSIATLPDGTYSVNFILGECSSSGSSVQGNIKYSGTFVKGPTPSTSTISANVGFSNISLDWVPVNTGIEEIKLGNLYTVYPNPTRSTIFVNGFDIKSVIIYNLEGKQLIKSIEPRVNLSALPRGTYMAEVATSKGLFMKKIVKE